VSAGPRRAALAALALTALAGACARKSAPATSASGTDAGSSGGGGKGPGTPTELGPGGDTLWLATVPGPYADLAGSVAADAAGGVVVAATTGTSASLDDLTVVRLAADGTVTSSRQFGSPSCSAEGSVLGPTSQRPRPARRW